MAVTLETIELDAESGCYEIALFEVIKGENGPGVSMETRLDLEVMTAACQEIVDTVGPKLDQLVGLQIFIQARPTDETNLAFFASLGFPEEASPDLALAGRAVQAAMKVIIEGLLPGSEIKSVYTHDRSMMN